MWDCMGLYVMIGGMIDVKQFSPFFLEDHQRGSNQGGSTKNSEKHEMNYYFDQLLEIMEKTGVVMRF
jgi:hypothetical protein